MKIVGVCWPEHFIRDPVCTETLYVQRPCMYRDPVCTETLYVHGQINQLIVNYIMITVRVNSTPYIVEP